MSEIVGPKIGFPESEKFISGNEGSSSVETEKDIIIEEIKFPEDKEIARKLFDKADEYDKRFLEQCKIAAPEQLFDTVCKKEIIRELINKGSVNRDKTFARIKENYPKLEEDIFENAFRVIENYVINGGEDVIGGTGLRMDKEREYRDFENAGSFNELYDTLKYNNGIEGSTGFYPSSKIIEIIEGVREGKYDINNIPRTDGLRDKVKDLLALEKVRENINNNQNLPM